jgi:hypothetical protein
MPKLLINQKYSLKQVYVLFPGYFYYNNRYFNFPRGEEPFVDFVKLP